jgi:pyruvate dehydrogenase (quinone)
MEPAVTDPPKKHGRQHSTAGFTPSLPVPPDDLLQRAADVLNAGRKVAILAGAGALHASGSWTAWRNGSVPASRNRC